MIKLDFSEQVIWITGASRGIGRAAALLFAQANANLVLCSRSIESLTQLREEVLAISGLEPLCLAYDVADLKAVKSTGQQILAKFKRLDVLVNNAGILQDALLGMISEPQLFQTLNVNLAAVIEHMQIASRLMQRHKKGSIINVSSIIGRVGNVGQVVYGASKAGVIGATLSAAKELAPSNIRVNAIAPGFIDTEMARSISPEKFQERLNSIKMGRIGDPQEVAGVVLFLASSLSSYVTGQVIGVDGGMLI
ncbi:MAG: 3-oxoacyl-ACP reductase [Gammaproteobacteria bacterium]|jgi:3-oxoacyl-[acyl-carrier protein] reductase|nr:3-oxoacyl-ACP reductase [Gammaproteobacteria bacterium]